MQQEETKTSGYTYPQEEEYSFRKALAGRKNDLNYLWTFKNRFIPVIILGALIGAIVAWYWPVTYTANLTFVVEESKAGGGSLVSALAGQFGFDIGDVGSKGGVLGGDNVLELLKSDKMIKETLITPYSENSSITLADRYAETYKLKKKWMKKYTSGKNITFPPERSKYSRLQDSLFFDIVKRIQEKDLSVGKPDKKLSFFKLTATMRDERLSALFCSRLIDQATTFYTQTKTKRLRANIAKLQQRADSLARRLNRKTYSASAANRTLLDINPAYPTANVSSELQERDKLVLSTIYSEVVKNLEVSKTMLAQETPTFQVVDEPELPLKKNELGYLKSSLIVILVLVGSYSAILLLKQ
jgi:hypothetical protein